MTREEAIGHLRTIGEYYSTDHSDPYEEYEILTKDELDAIYLAIKALEQEPLTDKEQRIFLAAIGREEKICREVDEKYPDREPYEDTLVSVCRSIERKVKKALWK